MNIAIDIRCLMTPIRTGVGEYTHELLQALFSVDQKNHYYLFYSSYENVDLFIPKWKQENVHYVKIKIPNKLFNFFQFVFRYPKLDRLIAKKTGIENIDYFFSPNINFTALSKNTKHILTIHDLSFEIFPDCYALRQRWWHYFVAPKKQCKKANIIVCPSQNSKRDVVAHFNINQNKIHVIYPGLSSAFAHTTANREQVKQKYKLPEHFIFFLGTLEPRKNIIGAIHAFSSRSRILDAGFEFIIAGPKGWHYEQIMNVIEQTKQVRYIGYIAHDEKRALYELADAFVFPSLYEGFGFPVLEAMAAGSPVITSNRSSLPEVTENTAYLVNPTDINDIGQGMERVLDNEELTLRFVKKAKEHSVTFSWEKAAREFLSIL